MKMLFFLFVAISQTVSLSMSGQSEFIRPRYTAIEPIFNWAKENEVSVNSGRVTHLLLDEYPVSSRGPFVGIGSRFSQDNRSFISKIGYCWYEKILGGRVQLLNYTDFRKTQFALRPEVGLSLVSWLNLLYGYTINLDTGDAFIMKGHTLSISLNISSYMLSN